MTEPLRLVSSVPCLRLADILTRASTVDGFLACDVGIASPGLDCVESMRVRKLEHYDDRVLTELEEQNVLMVDGSFQGQPNKLLGYVMDLWLSLWELAVAVEVWRRTAMMVRR